MSMHALNYPRPSRLLDRDQAASKGPRETLRTWLRTRCANIGPVEHGW
jgi:hypothetical protein